MASDSSSNSEIRSRDRLLVVDTADCAVEVLDAESLDRLGVTETSPMPHEVLLDERARRAYVCITYKDGYYNAYDERAQVIQVLDVDSMEWVDTIDIGPHDAPHGMALSPDRSLLYVSCESNGGELIAIELDRGEVIASVEVGAHGPHWITMLADGSKVYTANKEDPFVSVVDLAEMKMTARIPTPYGTEGIASAPDSSLVYISSQTKPELYVVDVGTDRISEIVALEEPPGAVATTPDGSKVLISFFNFKYWEKASPEPAYVQVLDAETLTGPDRIAIDKFPINITTSPDGQTAWVSCYASNMIVAIDVEESAAKNVAAAGQGPHGLVFVSGA